MANNNKRMQGTMNLPATLFSRHEWWQIYQPVWSILTDNFSRVPDRLFHELFSLLKISGGEALVVHDWYIEVLHVLRDIGINPSSKLVMQ